VLPPDLPQSIDDPLRYETIILANMVNPRDTEAFVMLMSFMIMTHNEVLVGRAELVQEVQEWCAIPMCKLDDRRLPATLYLDTLTELSGSSMLARLLTKSHHLFSYSNKPSNPDALAAQALEHYRAIKRVTLRIHLLFAEASNLLAP